MSKRVLTLRKAFQETLKDAAFLAEAEKAKLTLDPATAEDLERMMTEAFALEPRSWRSSRTSSTGSRAAPAPARCRA